MGSPPQVRGKPSNSVGVNTIDRITPAGAGKTAVNRRHAVAERDHPRRCGENLIRSVANALRKGSPPQVRGKLVNYQVKYPATRITPAGAGKTFRDECTVR